MDDFYTLVRRRRMTRSFSEEPVDPAAVDRILDAARRGPSAGFSQGVEFVLVTDEQTRRAIAAPGDEMLASVDMENFVAQAPVHVVIAANPGIYTGRYREPDKQRVVSDIDEAELWRIPWWFNDAGAAQMLILLAAMQEGLAVGYVGVTNEPHVRGLLGIPEDWIVIGVALLGHASPRAGDYGDVSAKPRKRRSFDDVVHREHW